MVALKATITGTSNITNENAESVTTGIKFKPKNGASDLLKWNVKPAAGLTFTPTKLSGYVNRCGTDAENGIVTFKYEITDDNIECYDEDFWTEYHEEGVENPEDALEEHFEEIIEGYDVPPEGDYKYDRSEEKLVSVDYDTEYYKRD